MPLRTAAGLRLQPQHSGGTGPGPGNGRSLGLLSTEATRPSEGLNLRSSRGLDQLDRAPKHRLGLTDREPRIVLNTLLILHRNPIDAAEFIMDAVRNDPSSDSTAQFPYLATAFKAPLVESPDDVFSYLKLAQLLLHSLSQPITVTETVREPERLESP